MTDGGGVPFRCSRPSKWAGWVVGPGEFVPARCGAPNKCAYCAYLATVENALVVQLDAERYGVPRVGMTLTTRDPVIDPGKFRKDVELVFRAFRRVCPEAQYLGLVEFTTGSGARSGGARRVHQHLLLRGVLPSQAELAEAVVREVWFRQTGADRVEVRELRSPAGATAYLVHHHRKRDQAPPAGWSGKRMRPSRGYFGEPIAGLRREARALTASARVRRAARRLVAWDELDGAPDDLVESEWCRAVAAARGAAERVTFVRVDRFGGIVAPRRAA